MTDREAMKMALEALEDSMYPQKKQFDAIVGLKQALAQEQTKCPRCGEVNPAEIHTCSPQPEQEPVKCTCGYAIGHPLVSKCICTPPKREWVGLHLDDMPESYAGDKSFLNIARWAEAKLKEKNAAPTAQTGNTQEK